MDSSSIVPEKRPLKGSMQKKCYFLRLNVLNVLRKIEHFYIYSSEKIQKEQIRWVVSGFSQL